MSSVLNVTCIVGFGPVELVMPCTSWFVLVRWQYSYEAWATGSPSLVFMPPVESWNLHDSSTHMDMDQNWIHMILHWENLRESSFFFSIKPIWGTRVGEFHTMFRFYEFRPWIFLSHWQAMDFMNPNCLKHPNSLCIPKSGYVTCIPQKNMSN